MTSSWRVVVGLAVLASLVFSCGDPTDSPVTGVVIAVDGNLQEVRSFTLLAENGDRLTFIPQEGVTFDGGPLSHLRDHIASGAPVSVDYLTDENGRLIAVEVSDE